MRRAYFFVPICPKCAGRQTGRFVREPHFYRDYTLEESLRSGEIIKYRKDVPQKNLFCLECGHTWSGRGKLRFITPDELENEKEARGTEEMYEEYMLKKEQGKNRRTGFWSKQNYDDF